MHLRHRLQLIASAAAARSDVGLVLEAETGTEGGSVLARARLVILAAPGHPLVKRTVTPDEFFEAAEVPPPRTQSLGSVEGVKRGILAGGARAGAPAGPRGGGRAARRGARRAPAHPWSRT